LSTVETSDRFLRPDDLRLIRRNRRQLQMERLLAFAGRLSTVALLLLLAYWIFERTQQDGRFAVRSVELAGVKHTLPADLDRVTKGYLGANLFSLDIARVEGELRKLPWVERVAIEKKLPSTLKITLLERQPVALATVNGVPRYVDQRGIAFADLSPAVGNPDLPLITEAQPHQILGCVRLLLALHKSDPALYSRISEISPDGETAFRIFDRDLKTFLYLEGSTAATKWRALYAIAEADGYRRVPAEYVDLRFANRIIVKPRLPAVDTRLPGASVASGPATDQRQSTTGEK
jgi:cell division septal protein FtsQ